MRIFRRIIITLLIGCFVSLVYVGGEIAEAQMGSRLLVFNPLPDLLKGDIWEYITQDDLGRHLYVYPEKYQAIGVGTTNWPYRMGEVLIRGKVGSPIVSWSNPEYPYRMKRVHEGVFPWMQVALFDPKKSLQWSIKKSQDLHGEIIARMEEEGINMCALSVGAVTTQVDYSVTFWIPKTGLDLSGPQGEKAHLRAFQDKTLARWALFGIYVKREMAKNCGMASGQPLLLAGYNRDTRIGGLVRFAKARNANIQYHPIEACHILQSDLVIEDVRVKENRVSIDVKNQGDLNVDHVMVRLTLPDSKREWEAVIPSLSPQEEKTIRFRFPRPRSAKEVVVSVDPENQILEADEENNGINRKPGVLGG
jgi:hypothetical protein